MNSVLSSIINFGIIFERISLFFLKIKIKTSTVKVTCSFQTTFILFCFISTWIQHCEIQNCFRFACGQARNACHFHSFTEILFSCRFFRSEIFHLIFYIWLILYKLNFIWREEGKKCNRLIFVYWMTYELRVAMV